MSVDPRPSEIFAILDDEYSRAILVATIREPRSGRALSEECDMSRATVSRRVNDLVEQGLLVERTRLDPEGHHFSEYEAVLERVVVRLLAEGFDVAVELREDPVDRLATIWEELRKA